MLGLRQLVALALVLLSLPACSEGNPTKAPLPPDGGSKTSGPIPLANVTAMFTQVRCEDRVRCRQYPDLDTCMESDPPWFEQPVAGVKAGRTQYDGNAAAECFDALRAQPWSCNQNDPSPPYPPACLQIFKGTGARGAACFHFGADCSSAACNDTSCPSDGTCCAGVCDDPPDTAHPIPLGGDCSAFTAVCADALSCSASAGSLTCVSVPPGLALGQDCNPNSSTSGYCPSNAKCEPSSSTLLGGTCTALPDEGDPCDPAANDCSTSYDYCDPVARTCVPKIAIGQPCPSGYGCVDYANCVSGTCVSQKRPGETCDELDPDACMGFLLCTNGICTLPTDLFLPVCP
jgi:hypothetical protein